MAKRTIRMLVDVGDADGELVDSNTGKRVFWRRGETLEFEIAFAKGAKLYNPTGAAFALECRERRNPSYVPFFEKTGYVGGPLLGAEDFANGGHHVTVTVPAEENTNTLPGRAWLTVTLSEGGETVSALASEVVVQEPGAAALVTAGEYEANQFLKRSERGAAGGVAELDPASGKVPATQLPLAGTRTFKGGWDAGADSPDLSALTPVAGDYYLVTAPGTDTLTGSPEDWRTGDEAVYDGSAWHRLDLQRNGTRTFADSAARLAATPDFLDQLAVQSDDGSLWRAADLAAGGFSGSVLPATLATYQAGDGREALRGSKLQRRSEQLATPVPQYLGGLMTEGFPERGGVDMKLRDGVAATRNYGFVKVCYSAARNRLVMFVRDASGHGTPPVDGHQEVWLSDDLGTTWRQSTQIAEVAGQDQRHVQPVFLQDGRLFCPLLRLTGSNPLDRTIEALWSDDYGESFTEAGTLIAPDTYEVVNGSNALQLADGSILLPYYVGTATYRKSMLLKSTDNGESWDTYALAGDGTVRDYSEPLVTVMDNGDLAAFLRSDVANSLWRCESSDGGETWDTPAEVADPNGDVDWVATLPAICKVPDGPVLMVHRKNGAPGNMRLSVSYDEGVTWEMETENFNPTQMADPTGPYSELRLQEAGWAVVNPGLVFLAYGGERADGVLNRSNAYVASLRTGAVYEGGATASPGIRLTGGGQLGPDLIKPPGMDSAEALARFGATPDPGTIYYDTTENAVRLYTGSTWEALPPRSLEALPALSSLYALLSPLGLDAGALATWSPDARDANGDFAAAGTTPAVDLTGRGAYPAVQFTDGEYKRGANSDWTFLSDGSAYTLVIAFKPPATDNILCTLADTGGISSAARGFFLAFDNRTGISRSNTVVCSVARTPTAPGNFAINISPSQANIPNDTVTPDAWNVVSVTCDGAGTVQIYVNGNLLGSDTVDGTGFEPTAPNTPMLIGRASLSGSSTYPMTGLVGDVGVWTTELAEVQRSYVERNFLR